MENIFQKQMYSGLIPEMYLGDVSNVILPGTQLTGICKATFAMEEAVGENECSEALKTNTILLSS